MRILATSLYCFECSIPSTDMLASEERYPSLSQPMIEKSDSTVLVLGNGVAKPPKNDTSDG
jgi:hypothetical protein